MTISKDMIVDVLKDGVAKVSFTKVDGSKREMNCTLQESYLPVRETKSTKKVESDDVLAVWDTDKNAWRSFRIDSVTAIHFNESS